MALSWFLRRDNKKIHEAEASGWTLEDGIDGKAGLADHREAPTVGRPLGGAKSGAVAKYDI